MPNTKKANTIQNLQEKIQKAKSITFVDYLGLSVNNISDFRSKIREIDGETVVTKNTLLKIALKEEKYPEKDFKEKLDGPTAAIFSYSDPFSPIKTIFEFSKRLELPKVKFSFIEKAYTSAEDVKTISELPSKEELLTKIVGSLNSPLSGFINVLGGTQRNFVSVISRIADTKK